MDIDYLLLLSDHYESLILTLHALTTSSRVV